MAKQYVTVTAIANVIAKGKGNVKDQEVESRIDREIARIVGNILNHRIIENITLKETVKIAASAIGSKDMDLALMEEIQALELEALYLQNTQRAGDMTMIYKRWRQISAVPERCIRNDLSHHR